MLYLYSSIVVIPTWCPGDTSPSLRTTLCQNTCTILQCGLIFAIDRWWGIEVVSLAVPFLLGHRGHLVLLGLVGTGTYSLGVGNPYKYHPLGVVSYYE